jgi:predicted phage tail protein
VIRIAPVVAGAAKSGLGQVLLGAALITAAIFMPPSIGAISLFGSATVASVVGSIGVSLVLGGVAQMLSPPKDLSPGSQDTSSPSYAFNGAVNTTAQGNPVPVGYGRLIVGSAVISAGISTQDIALT